MKIVYKNTPNQYDLDGEVEAILLHTTLGDYKGAVEWLMMSPEERERITGKKTYSSANAVFGRLGQITELAPPNRATWHAGAVYKPTQRAKDILPKTILGTLKNPNKRTLGLEVASGYDIDRDGMLEGWERLYTVKEIKACAWYILNRIEPVTGKTFGSHNILTHFDTNTGKPNLEIQRIMVLAELSKQRKALKKPVVVEPKKDTIISIDEGGKKLKFACQEITK